MIFIVGFFREPPLEEKPPIKINFYWRFLSLARQFLFTNVLYFYLYLTLHACAPKFEVTGNLKDFVNFFFELNNASKFRSELGNGSEGSSRV